MSDERPDAARQELDSLVAELKSRVDRRREEGVYPEGFERDLDDHFRRITGRGDQRSVDALDRRLQQLRGSAAFSPERIAAESGLPGGQALHRAVGRVVSRQTAGILEQLQGFADELLPLLSALIEAMGDASGHVHADLLGQIDATLDR